MRIFSAVFAATAALWLTSPAQADTIYSVRNGDSLGKIAQAYGLTIEQIVRANPSLTERSAIRAGTVIILPEEEKAERRSARDLVVEDPLVIAGVSHDPPRATAIQIEGRGGKVSANGRVTEVPAAAQPDDEYVLDRSGDYRRRSLASRGGAQQVHHPLMNTAHRFIGTPYSFGGTTERGIDCSGFVMRVFSLHGIKLPRTADVQFNVGSPVRRGQEQAGDLVFFETYCAGPSHVGIYLGEGKFIHASSSRGVTVSSLTDKYYRGKYLGAKRVLR